MSGAQLVAGNLQQVAAVAAAAAAAGGSGAAGSGAVKAGVGAQGATQMPVTIPVTAVSLGITVNVPQQQQKTIAGTPASPGNWMIENWKQKPEVTPCSLLYLVSCLFVCLCQ